MSQVLMIVQPFKSKLYISRLIFQLVQTICQVYKLFYFNVNMHLLPVWDFNMKAAMLYLEF